MAEKHWIGRKEVWDKVNDCHVALAQRLGI